MPCRHDSPPLKDDVTAGFQIGNVWEHGGTGRTSAFASRRPSWIPSVRRPHHQFEWEAAVSHPFGGSSTELLVLLRAVCCLEDLICSDEPSGDSHVTAPQGYTWALTAGYHPSDTPTLSFSVFCTKPNVVQTSKYEVGNGTKDPHH